MAILRWRSGWDSIGRVRWVVAYVFRFVNNCILKRRTTSSFNFKAVTRGQIHFVKAWLAFLTGKWSVLKNKISKPSSLQSLNPFLDDQGLMCISGRLAAASELPYDEKHPIILPYNSQLARLLVLFTHKISLHGGNQLVHRLIRLQFTGWKT